MNADEKKQLHETTIDELRQEAAELDLEIKRARLEIKAGKLENTSKLGQLRNRRAVIQTIKREKELAAQAAA